MTVYALEMLDDVAESIDYSGKEPETRAQLKTLALNGAENWEEYSWGGSALIYNGDIAERITPKTNRRRGCQPDHYRRRFSSRKWEIKEKRGFENDYN